MFSLHPLNPYRQEQPAELYHGFTFYEPSVGEITLTRKSEKHGKFYTDKAGIYVELDTKIIHFSNPYRTPQWYPCKKSL